MANLSSELDDTANEAPKGHRSRGLQKAEGSELILDLCSALAERPAAP